MVSSRVNRNKKFLEYYLEADKTRRRSLLQSAKKDQIDCICEVALNVLKKNVPVSSSVRDQLSKHRKYITKIAVEKGAAKSKKRVLVQRGGAFLPLLLSTVLPFLAEKVFGALSK